MGWYFDEWDDRKATIAKLTNKDEIKVPEGVVVRTCLAHTYKGFPFSGTLYAVYEDEMFDPEKTVKKWTKRWIAVILLKYARKQWGYKPMEEGMGPHYYACPLKYLDMVPEVGNATWRAAVRDHWENRKKVRRDSRLGSSRVGLSRSRKARCSGCGVTFVTGSLHPYLGLKEVKPVGSPGSALELMGLCPSCGGRCYSPASLVQVGVKNGV